MTTTPYPIFHLITSAKPASGLISKAREIAAEYGGNFRAPHHTASRSAMGAEMALAAGGVFLLDEPAEFSRSAVSTIANLWALMDPACRPEMVITLRGEKTEESTLKTLARFTDVFEGWAIDEHHSVG